MCISLGMVKLENSPVLTILRAIELMKFGISEGNTVVHSAQLGSSFVKFVLCCLERLCSITHIIPTTCFSLEMAKLQNSPVLTIVSAIELMKIWHLRGQYG